MLQRSFFISVFRRRPGCFSPAENLGDLRFFHPLPLYADEAENKFFNVQFEQIPFYAPEKRPSVSRAMVEARSGSEAMASVV